MAVIGRRLPALFWLVSGLLFAVGVLLVLGYAPVDATWGPVQKVLYLHLPVAMNMFVAAFVVFAAGIGYIWQRHEGWDRLAVASARVAVVSCSIVLLTGMIWARSAWGTWWTWSPRLTFSLVLWLLYVGFLAARPFAPRDRRAAFSAVYGIVAFLDVPLLYLSIMLLPDIHPTHIDLTPEMRATLSFWYLPVTLMCGGMIYDGWSRGSMPHGSGSAALMPSAPRIRGPREGAAPTVVGRGAGRLR